MKKQENSLVSPQTVTSDGNKVSIKGVIVADPSIAFTIHLDSTEFPYFNGYCLTNFELKVLLNNIDPANPAVFTEVARINIKGISQHSLYFNIPFGDPNYNPGEEFTLKISISADSPVTGEPIRFNDGKPYSIPVFGGGVPKEN